MATNLDGNLRHCFPGLRDTPYSITSPSDNRYNCIAWAAGDASRWWEPDPMGLYYWPPGAPRAYSLQAFKEAFRVLGFEEGGTTEPGPLATEIAIYSKGERPTHAARHVSDERWSSKLGRSVDIEHELLALCGDAYGAVALFMKRPPPPDR